MRILFDKNVPVGVRHFLAAHEVRTVVEPKWPPQLENGKLLAAAESEGYEVLVPSGQNILYQQNLTNRRLALVVLGSNIWPIVTGHAASIVDNGAPGSYHFVEMKIPRRPRTPSK